MTSRDWDFIMGDFGNPLFDIKEWMLPPYPSWMPLWQRSGELRDIQKEDICREEHPTE